jgi:hypothetical protein
MPHYYSIMPNGSESNGEIEYLGTECLDMDKGEWIGKYYTGWDLKEPIPDGFILKIGSSNHIVNLREIKTDVDVINWSENVLANKLDMGRYKYRKQKCWDKYVPSCFKKITMSPYIQGKVIMVTSNYIKTGDIC